MKIFIIVLIGSLSLNALAQKRPARKIVGPITVATPSGQVTYSSPVNGKCSAGALLVDSCSSDSSGTSMGNSWTMTPCCKGQSN